MTRGLDLTETPVARVVEALIMVSQFLVTAVLHPVLPPHAFVELVGARRGLLTVRLFLHYCVLLFNRRHRYLHLLPSLLPPGGLRAPSPLQPLPLSSGQVTLLVLHRY